MKLIICEKPSLAKNVKNALETREHFSRENGYYDGQNYLITYCFGHLFSLCDVDDYTGQHLKWSIDDLPIVPNPFRYKLRDDSGVKKQYRIIQDLLNRSDVDAIIHCGDADREGELIVRNVLQQAGNHKPVYRLWLPEQTSKTILNGLDHLKLDNNYDNLAREGEARTYIDWLFGINLTRYLTCATKTFYPCGRVIVPIVKTIYDRCMEIRNFKSETYYVCQHKGDGYELTAKKKFKTKAEADEFNKVLNAGPIKVSSVEQRNAIAKPPKLFSLSGLQGVLSKRYKMSLKASMALIQSLYEKGYLTYPRTNTEYLAEDEADKIKLVIQKLKQNGYSVKFRDGKSIFDNSKIESHSAITPTYNIATGLTGDEQKVYDTVVNRFCAVFCAEDCVLKKTDVIFKLANGEALRLHGNEILQPGFLKYEPGARNSNIIPSFRLGQEIPAQFRTTEKHTSPPKYYTVDSLMNFLKDPYRDMSTDDDTEEYKRMLNGIEIGTEATRTGIIENAKKYQYIEEKKGTYRILPQGEKFIQALDQCGVNLYKEKSVELGKLLKDVNHGDKTTEEAVSIIHKELDHEIDKTKGPIDMSEKIGTCPWCGGDVYKDEKRVYCRNHHWNPKEKKVEGCKLSFFINSKLYSLSDKDISELLTNGKTSEKIAHGKKKSGNGEWSCYIKLDPDNKYITSLDFGD